MIQIVDAWIFVTSMVWLLVTWSGLKTRGLTPATCIALACGSSGFALLWLR